jgi:hypothetical protein
MRRLLILAIAANFSFACADEDPPPLYVDVDYQVRCIECQPIAPDDAVRRVDALDGERGFAVECNVTRREGDRLLTFNAAYTDPDEARNNYSIGLIQVNLDGAGPGNSCRVTVVEGNNSYEGLCTNDDPSSEQPCRVELEAEDGIVMGSVLCENVPNRNQSMLTRHLVAPNSQSAARFEVHGCVDL